MAPDAGEVQQNPLAVWLLLSQTLLSLFCFLGLLRTLSHMELNTLQVLLCLRHF